MSYDMTNMFLDTTFCSDSDEIGLPYRSIAMMIRGCKAIELLPSVQGIRSDP